MIVFSTAGDSAELPDSIAIIGGAPDGYPQLMHYFDARGWKRLLMTTFEGRPGEWGGRPATTGTAGTARFNQRFVGELSPEGTTIKGRWGRPMGGTGRDWEIDFPITCVRREDSSG